MGHKLLNWCRRRNTAPCRTTVQQLAEFFLYLSKKSRLSVLAIKGYRATLNHVFDLKGTALADKRIISRMPSSRDKDISDEGTLYQCSGDEGSSTSMFMVETLVLLSDNASGDISKKAREHSISGHVTDITARYIPGKKNILKDVQISSFTQNGLLVLRCLTVSARSSVT